MSLPYIFTAKSGCHQPAVGAPGSAGARTRRPIGPARLGRPGMARHRAVALAAGGYRAAMASLAEGWLVPVGPAPNLLSGPGPGPGPPGQLRE